MERTGHGSLVLVGSTAGLYGEAGHADYASAKSAIVRGLLLSLKNEIVRIAPLGRVNAVCPGWTVSPMTRSTLDEPGLVDRVTRTMALRKVAEPEDVARQIVVLASDELSGHVTGQVVTVAGGMEGRVLHAARRPPRGWRAPSRAAAVRVLADDRLAPPGADAAPGRPEDEREQESDGSRDHEDPADGGDLDPAHVGGHGEREDRADDDQEDAGTIPMKGVPPWLERDRSGHLARRRLR